VAFIRRHPLLTGLAVACAAVLGILLVTGIAVWRAAHDDEARRVDHVDAILVLGAAQYSGTPSPILEARLQQAALMYERGFAPTVAVLGSNLPGDVTTEAEAGRQWLIEEARLPSDAVFAVPVGNTSLESIKAASQWMRERGYHSAFLVSDPWHNLRIRRMARDQGIEAHVSATFRSAATSRWTRLKWYGRETLAYLYYRVTGE
jgi:uncharacterized SAM-binding protein YcdF (DUF218 family)